MDKPQEILQQIEREIALFKGEVALEETGIVTEVGDGVVRIAGLASAMMSEMLSFKDNAGGHVAYGVVFNLEEYSAGAIVLGDFTVLREGIRVERLKKVLSVPVSESLLHRVVDALVQPIDGRGVIKTQAEYPVEKIAPGIRFREPVTQPVQTGIKAIDAMIPIGRGQRELIIGDRQTGKTAIAVDTIINQKGQDMVCIYVAIGQKESKVAKIVSKLEESGAMDHTIIVSAPASAPASLQYLAPYVGAAIGEFFMDKGRDALVVFDDLSKHAWAYRQISLLLRRPPGREAYPGDVFYLHSRLLERAARKNKEHGGGSLTALPIIETQMGDVSAYIPTNVISITDGQIYLESDLFYRGIRPAINVGLSVSRVGGAAQVKAMKKVAGKIRLELAQFRELEAFANFASDLDSTTRSAILRGKRLTEVLKQTQYSPMPVPHQVAILYAVLNGYLDDVKVEKVQEFETAFHVYLKAQGKSLMESIADKKELTPELEEKLRSLIGIFKQGFVK